jgi:hypothetical protein
MWINGESRDYIGKRSLRELGAPYGAVLSDIARFMCTRAEFAHHFKNPTYKNSTTQSPDES